MLSEKFLCFHFYKSNWKSNVKFIYQLFFVFIACGEKLWYILWVRGKKETLRLWIFKDKCLKRKKKVEILYFTFHLVMKDMKDFLHFIHWIIQVVRIESAKKNLIKRRKYPYVRIISAWTWNNLGFMRWISFLYYYFMIVEFAHSLELYNLDYDDGILLII